MAKAAVPLTKLAIKTAVDDAKKLNKQITLYDGGGLQLITHKSGRQVYRFTYKNKANKWQTITIGDAEYITLTQARAAREEFKGRLAKGLSPIAKSGTSFEEIAREWFIIWEGSASDSHRSGLIRAMETYIFPKIGAIDISNIKTLDAVTALRTIESAGYMETLKKVRSVMERVYKYAISTGITEYNPISQIESSVFKKQIKENYKWLPIRKIYMINNVFHSTTISLPVKSCIEFMIRTMARPGEASQAEWKEFDFIENTWTIPAEKMKMRSDHIVLLSSQTIALLNKLKEYSGESKFVFLNIETGKNINRESLARALKRAGVDSTAHGFRHLVSTVLNESRIFSPDAIESCLSHKDQNLVRATYNKAQYLSERRKLLQWWSDFIDMCNTEENNLKALKKFSII